MLRARHKIKRNKWDYLNKRYIEIFTKVCKNCTPKTIDNNNEYIKSDEERAIENLQSEAKYLVEDISMPARRKAREEMDSKLRDTPLGKIEQASNMTYLFKRVANKFKKKNSEEKNEE